MGLISILPDNSKLYYSTVECGINIVKNVLSTTPIYEGGEHLTRELGTSPTSNIIGYDTIWEYNINGDFYVWNNESDYKEQKTVNNIGKVNVATKSLTLPEENVYQIAYGKLKEDLSRYNTTLQDDI